MNRGRDFRFQEFQTEVQKPPRHNFDPLDVATNEEERGEKATFCKADRKVWITGSLRIINPFTSWK